MRRLIFICLNLKNVLKQPYLVMAHGSQKGQGNLLTKKYKNPEKLALVMKLDFKSSTLGFLDSEQIPCV